MQNMVVDLIKNILIGSVHIHFGNELMDARLYHLRFQSNCCITKVNTNTNPNPKSSYDRELIHRKQSYDDVHQPLFI